MKQKGFTLLELLIVVSAILILGVIFIGPIYGIRCRNNPQAKWCYQSDTNKFEELHN